jgi:hypothetical protein
MKKHGIKHWKESMNYLARMLKRKTNAVNFKQTKT